MTVVLSLAGRLLKALLWCWPLWLALLAWSVGGSMAEGTELYRSAQVAAVALLFLPALLCSAYELGPKWLVFVAALVAMAAGVQGLSLEHARVWPSFAAGGYSVGAIGPYLDYPLIATSLLALLSPPAVPVLRWRASIASGRRIGTLLGSARWMTLTEAKRLFANGDLIIGEAYDPLRSPKAGGAAPLLRFDGSSHLLTVAGSGSGKTTSVAIPNCLSWRGGLVVHDPKGELAAICGPERRAAGREVFVFDVLRAESDSVNVLEWLDPASPRLIDDVRVVVSWLSGGKEPEGQNAYFEQRGRDLLALYILIVVTDAELPAASKSLAAVDYLLSALDQEFLEAAAAKQGAVFQSIARSFAGEQPKQLSYFVSHAHSLLAPVKSEAARDLVSGKEGGRRLPLGDLALGGIDVFVCIPMRDLDANPALARLLIGTLLNAAYQTGNAKQRTLFLLDEMPRLRHMPLLETARDAGRGQNVTLWSIVQDLGQLEKHYGEEGLRSWLENSQIKTFFGISEFSVAEILSKTIGSHTLTVRSTTRPKPTDLFPSKTDAPHERPLMTPDEVMRMAVDAHGLPDEQIVLVRNRPPLRCGLAKYYRRPELTSLAQGPGQEST